MHANSVAHSSSASRRAGAIACLCGLCLLLNVGCSNMHEGPNPRNTTGWSQIRLPNIDRDTAFEAGQYALGQWFRIAEASQEDGLVRSAVEEYDQKGGTGRLSEVVVEQKHRMRHSAMLKIEQEGGVCLAKCRVRVQRLDTASHQAFEYNRQFDDLPNQTPIDRGAGASASQNQVWTDLRPDRDLERKILEVTRKRAQGEPAAESAEVSLQNDADAEQHQ